MKILNAAVARDISTAAAAIAKQKPMFQAARNVTLIRPTLSQTISRQTLVSQRPLLMSPKASLMSDAFASAANSAFSHKCNALAMVSNQSTTAQADGDGLLDKQLMQVASGFCSLVNRSGLSTVRNLQAVSVSKVSLVTTLINSASEVHNENE